MHDGGVVVRNAVAADGRAGEGPEVALRSGPDVGGDDGDEAVAVWTLVLVDQSYGVTQLVQDDLGLEGEQLAGVVG